MTELGSTGALAGSFHLQPEDQNRFTATAFHGAQMEVGYHTIVDGGGLRFVAKL